MVGQYPPINTVDRSICLQAPNLHCTHSELGIVVRRRLVSFGYVNTMIGKMGDSVHRQAVSMEELLMRVFDEREAKQSWTVRHCLFSATVRTHKVISYGKHHSASNHLKSRPHSGN